MDKKIKYIIIGFTNAFGSSKSFYPTKKLWKIVWYYEAPQFSIYSKHKQKHETSHTTECQIIYTAC